MDDFMMDDDIDLDDLEVGAFGFALTVAQSKRLIARGIAEDDRVMAAMEDGMVAVCKGTTNAYVLEELLGRDIEKAKYVLGRVLPEGDKRAETAFNGQIPEVVFRHGEVVEGMSVAQAVQEMQVGDVVLKGANAIDYTLGAAAVLVGHPTGGTLGAVMGCVYGKGLELIIPVGLEKQIAGSLDAAVSVCSPAMCAQCDLPRLWPVRGSLFTEIEALSTLTGVITAQVASGGVCGAEGGVWLVASGLAESVDETRELITEIQREPSFWDAVTEG